MGGGFRPRSKLGSVFALLTFFSFTGGLFGSWGTFFASFFGMGGRPGFCTCGFRGGWAFFGGVGGDVPGLDALFGAGGLPTEVRFFRGGLCGLLGGARGIDLALSDARSLSPSVKSFLEFLFC